MNMVRKRISVLELGFGDARKITALAKKPQHKNRRFVGIEWEEQKKLNLRLPNLRLTFGDSFTKLRRMSPESVNSVTADFFLSEFKINGREIHDHLSIRKQVQQKYDVKKIKTIKEVFRVLAKNGRLYVIEYGSQVNATIALLKEAGFVCTKKPVAPNQMHRTEFLTDISHGMSENPTDAHFLRPFIITARKSLLGKV
jgi:hypothetical protein